MQNEYYEAMLRGRKQRHKEELKSSLVATVVIVTLTVLFGTMLYFENRDPPMYIEADDGTLSVNPAFAEKVEQERKESLVQYTDSEDSDEEDAP